MKEDAANDEVRALASGRREPVQPQLGGSSPTTVISRTIPHARQRARPRFPVVSDNLRRDQDDPIRPISNGSTGTGAAGFGSGRGFGVRTGACSGAWATATGFAVWPFAEPIGLFGAILLRGPPRMAIETIPLPPVFAAPGVFAKVTTQLRY
jgi:hypothetical protein